MIRVEVQTVGRQPIKLRRHFFAGRLGEMKGDDPWEAFRVLKNHPALRSWHDCVANEMSTGNEYVVVNCFTFDGSHMNRFVDLNIVPN